MRKRKNGLSFYEKKNTVSIPLVKEILVMAVATVLTVFLAVVLVFSMGLRINVVGVSMEPTLDSGQKILVNRFLYTISAPKRGDIIVFRPGGNPNSHYYVKRIVGMPGETIQIMEGKMYINGSVVEEEGYDKIEDAGIAEKEVTLGNNEYFVLGDNRNASEDSRSANIGSISRESIYGKVWFHFRSEDSGMGMIR